MSRCGCGLQINPETNHCRANCPRNADKKKRPPRIKPEPSKERGFSLSKAVSAAVKKLGIQDGQGWRAQTLLPGGAAHNRKKEQRRKIIVARTASAGVATRLRGPQDDR